MLYCGTQQRLDKEQQHGDQNEPGNHFLRFGQFYFPGLFEIEVWGLFSVPANLARPAAVDGEDQTDTTDQRN